MMSVQEEVEGISRESGVGEKLPSQENTQHATQHSTNILIISQMQPAALHSLSLLFSFLHLAVSSSSHRQRKQWHEAGTVEQQPSIWASEEYRLEKVGKVCNLWQSPGRERGLSGDIKEPLVLQA